MDQSMVASLPKLELHIHLEGCIGAALLSLMTAGGRLGAGAIRRMYSFEDFPGFLKAYSRVMAALETPGDFRQAAHAISLELHRRGVVYAEFTFTPLPHARRGLNHHKVIENLLLGLEDAHVDGSGLESAFIYDTVRQWGGGAALESVELAIADRKHGLPVVGFGVGGDEFGCPAEELRPAFEKAAAAGLHRFVHAGEVGGPESVREAVEVLGAERIGHGVSSIRDPELVAMLAEKQICLDICPTSNQFTRAVSLYSDSPWRRLAAAGVPVTIGSDDPGFFGAWLDEELARCAQVWKLGAEDIRDLMLTAARHSFQPVSKKDELKALVESGWTVA